MIFLRYFNNIKSFFFCCGAQKQNLCQTEAESKVQHRQCIIPTSSTKQRQSGEQVVKSETSQRQNKEKIKHQTPGAEEVEKIARRWSKT